MPALLSAFLTSLFAIFVVVDPIQVAPMLAAMTAGRSTQEVKQTARRASIAGALLLLFFAIFGQLLFKLLRVDLSAFRVAGGLLLLLTALDMLRGKASACRCSRAEIEEGARKDDIAIVPLATPLLAGPGAIATVMVLMADRPGALAIIPVAAAILVTFAVSYLTLRAGQYVRAILGTSGMAMLQRIMGLLLAAVSVQFMAEGARRLLS